MSSSCNLKHYSYILTQHFVYKTEEVVCLCNLQVKVVLR